MSEAGCYTLDLYCDNVCPEVGVSTVGATVSKGQHIYDEFPHQFTGHTYQECKRNARLRGWIFKKDRIRICPRCAGKNGAR